MYPELVVQHDVSTQADIFLACSSPKEPGTSAVEGDVIRTSMLISYIAFYYIKLYSLQEEYLPTDDATTEEEEEPAEEDI